MLRIDKEFQGLLMPLSEDEFSLLEKSILAEGCRVAIDVWQGVIIDGHNRHTICQKHGIEFETNEIDLPDRAAVINWIDDNQLGRRNLTADQFRFVLGRRYNREKKAQGGTGANQHKSQRDQIDTSAKTADRLAKEHGVSAATVKRAGKFAEEAEKTPELLDGLKTKTPIQKIKKEIQQKKTEAERKTVADKGASVKPSDRWNIYKGDIRDWVAPKQYDWIITDPPYPKEYLPLWSDLGRCAAEFLKDGGLLVAMSGQSYLDEIYASLIEHLDYYWTACYLTPGQPTPLRQVNVNTTWKPLLIFSKGKYKGKIFGDVFKSDKNEKDHHKWGQSVSGMTDIVSKICLPGQHILDPFCGAGTTGIAAIKHGCFFDGLEIDQENVNISKGRLNDAN